MDPRIRNLTSTTFCGERVARHQIAEIQELVRFFPHLSRTELAHTVCVQLGWLTPGGRNRLRFAQRVLAALERRRILTLPAPRHAGRGPQRPLPHDRRTDPQPPVSGRLSSLEPLRLAVVRRPSERQDWNRWIDRHHPLGYRQPIGCHVRYWALDRSGRRLGGLLFDFATRRLPCRDAWIGWQDQPYRPQLRLVVRNARHLVFPWVQVRNLASRVLALAARRLPGDWERYHGYRPVLCETFVNPRQQRGTCYRAAGWQLIGATQARAARGGQPAKRPKQVWVLPLQAGWREILLAGRGAGGRSRSPRGRGGG